MSEEKIINNLYQKSICVNAGGKGCYSPYSDEKEWSDDIDVLLEMYQNSQNENKRLQSIIKEVREDLHQVVKWCTESKHNEDTTERYLVVDYGTIVGKINEIRTKLDKGE